MQRVLIEQLQNVLIIDTVLGDMDLIKELRGIRQAFEIFVLKDLNDVSLRTQYQLNIPIWDT
jgi:hypothetical protein